jgi:hypothetical protein
MVLVIAAVEPDLQRIQMLCDDTSERNGFVDLALVDVRVIITFLFHLFSDGVCC